MEDVLAYLRSHNIEFIVHEHIAVFTAAEAAEFTAHIPGLACKNLLLNDQKKKNFYLVVLPANSSANLASLSPDKKLSFTSADRMEAKLGLLPGSVSPFGLINNREADVELWLDRTVYEADIVTFHPNQNTATLELTREAFHKYLHTLTNSIKII